MWGIWSENALCVEHKLVRCRRDERGRGPVVPFRGRRYEGFVGGRKAASIGDQRLKFVGIDVLHQTAGVGVS